jgi:uncharacterized membrane protein
MLRADAGLVIDWTQMPTYNTIMSVCAGAGLLSVVWFAYRLVRDQRIHYEGFALNFGVIGLILTITGTHMTLTWPFAKYFPFDNIIFGEPSLAFGVLLLGAALFLWRRSARLIDAEDPAAEITGMLQPLSILIVGLGLALLAIAAAGITFQLFAAPPEEPISGAFAAYPWVEATFMSGLFALVGVGTLLLPFALRFTPGRISAIQWIVGVTLALGGLAFFLFGALNFFTHIGLIIHTMK